MSIQYLDMLSPPITLYYKGNLSHSSLFAVMASIITYCIIFGFTIYYSLGFFNHNSMAVYHFDRFIDDAGNFPINSSMIFSCVNVYDLSTSLSNRIDYDSLRIIGINRYLSEYTSDYKLENFDHWLYGNCNNTDLGKLLDLNLFFPDYYSNAACIRKYYSKKEHKYYEINDKNFIWPEINHGTSNPNSTTYGIIVEKCQNDSLRELTHTTKCKSDEIINEYIKFHAIGANIVDHYTDVLNYKHPITKYDYLLTDLMYEGSYIINNINFYPATIKDNKGFLLNNIKQEKYYTLTREQKIVNTDNIGIYSAFYFLMQNREEYYERVYTKIQDILGNIGGLANMILLIAKKINLLASKYIILIDTLKLRDSRNKSINIRDIKSKKTVSKEKNENISKLKSDYEKSKSLIVINNKNKNMINKIDNKNFKNKKKEQFYKHIIFPNESKDNSGLPCIMQKNEDLNLIEAINIIKNTKKILTRKNTKININVNSYISYLICRNNLKIEQYDNFRKRILSEENLIRIDLLINKLSQVNT